VKRETDNKSLHLTSSWFQKNIFKNVSGSNHKKKIIITSTFVSASTAKLDVLILKKKSVNDKKGRKAKIYSICIRYPAGKAPGQEKLSWYIHVLQEIKFLVILGPG